MQATPTHPMTTVPSGAARGDDIKRILLLAGPANSYRTLGRSDHQAPRRLSNLWAILRRH